MGFACSHANATKVTATQNGNWNQATTWDPNIVPGCFDTIVIPPTITVTITVTVNLTSCPPVYILVQGTLAFQSGKKLDLPNGSVVYIAPGGQLNGGGGGGNSNWITIGGTPYWSAGDGNVSGPAIFCQACSLPIELINFTASLYNRKVYLDWQTASETDNDYFVIQRSPDGFNWEPVDTIDGALNSSVLISYNSIDASPYLGLSYYRLKQVDMNGVFSYSDVRVISNGEFYSDQDLLVITDQNGFQQNVVIYFAEPITGNAEVFIYSLNGSVIAQQTFNVTDEQWVVIEVDQRLATGVYAIKANRLIEKTFLR